MIPNCYKLDYENGEKQETELKTTWRVWKGIIERIDCDNMVVTLM